MKQCVPSYNDVERLEHRVSDTIELAHQSASKTAHERSSASKRVIDTIVQGCAAHMERVSWFTRAVDEIYTLHVENQAHLLELVQRFREQMEIRRAERESRNDLIERTKKLKSTRILRIREIAYSRREQLIKAGENPASAELDAYTEVIQSTEDEIVELRREIQAYDEVMNRCKSKVDIASAASRFYTTIMDLLEAIGKQQEQDIKVHLLLHV